jgi:hypothetical protein
MSEARVKLQPKIRLFLEKLEQGIRECRTLLKAQPKEA